MPRVKKTYPYGRGTRLLIAEGYPSSNYWNHSFRNGIAFFQYSPKSYPFLRVSLHHDPITDFFIEKMIDCTDFTLSRVPDGVYLYKK